MADLWDAELDITTRSRHELRAMPITLRHTVRAAFAGGGADRRSELRLDQLLKSDREDVTQRRRQAGIGAGKSRGKIGQGKLVGGHRASFSLAWSLSRIAR